MVKKLLSFLLVFSLVLGFVPAAFAKGSEVDLSRFKKGTGYVAFGDSITRGYGASDKWWDDGDVDGEGYRFDSIPTDDHLERLYCRNVTGSYPKLVADRIGCNAPDYFLDKDGQYWAIAQDAVTTALLLDLFGVDDNYCDKDYLYSYNAGVSRYETLLYYFANKDSFNMDGESRYGDEGCIMPIRDLIKESSLISIAIGMGDIWNRSRSVAQDSVETLDLSDTEALVTLVKVLVKEMYNGYDRWKKNFPLILDYFKKNAPNTPVVIVGSFNPVFNMTINNEYLIPIGTALSGITSLMNENYKKWAEEYGYIFVDISNVETGSTEKQVGLMEFISEFKNREQGLATHPSPNGYAQISRLVIDALEKEVTHKKTLCTDIKIDLGRFDNVTDVKLNGRSISKRRYSFEDHVLTVHGITGLAKKLAVYSDVNGKTGLTLYSLECDHGCKAYRSYTVNDIDAVLQSFKNNISGIIKSGT